VKESILLIIQNFKLRHSVPCVHKHKVPMFGLVTVRAYEVHQDAVNHLVKVTLLNEENSMKLAQSTVVCSSQNKFGAYAVQAFSSCSAQFRLNRDGSVGGDLYDDHP